MSQQNITLDLNGNTITGKDAGKVNFTLFYVFKGEFTVIDSQGNGKITLEAENNRGWGSMSVVIGIRAGIVNIKGGSFEHLGGTDMAYAIDVSSNSYGDVTLNVEDGKLRSTYTAIRLYMSPAGTCYVNIKDGDIDGSTSAIWAQAPSDNAGQKGEIKISGGNIGVINTARNTASDVSVEILGGTFKNFKTENGELKIKGGHVAGTLNILNANGETVTSDSIVSGGTFTIYPEGYVDADAIEATITKEDESVLYVFGLENVKEIVHSLVKGDVILVNGDAELVEVPIGVTVKAKDGSQVTANGKEVTKDGLTIESTVKVEISVLEPTEEVKKVEVGVSNAEATEEVLNETLELIKNDENNKALADIIKNNHVKIQVSIDVIDENSNETIDEKIIKEMKDSFNDVTLATFFDIDIEITNAKTDEVLGTVSSLSKDIELKVLLPEALQNSSDNVTRTYYIIRRHVTDDGVKIEKLDATLSEDGKSLSFKSADFSEYAIAYSDTLVKVEETPDTYDGLGKIAILGTISLIGLVVSAIYIKKEMNKKVTPYK